MSFAEVKNLRKSGKLEEAKTLAEDYLSQDGTNIWNKRSAAWVYYDYLKHYKELGNVKSFVETLEQINDLELGEDEQMIYDTCAWPIVAVVHQIQKQGNVDYSWINRIFKLIQQFNFTKKTVAYSAIYNAFHKGYKNWSNYLEFANWWGFENFIEENYEQESFNGRKTMALVEQAYIAYAKGLIDGKNKYGLEAFKEDIQKFLLSLDDLITRCPDYQYPAYFKAQLLLALGDSGNILGAFLPFARQKKNDFWVWDLMADIFQTEDTIQYACYCKALSLKTPEAFLGKVRMKFIKLLLKRSMFREAKTELLKVLATREKEGWKLTKVMEDWKQSTWFKESKAFRDNQLLYRKYLSVAELLLYRDITEQKVVVSHLNREKKILNFIESRDKVGFGSYKNHFKELELGDVLSVRLREGKEQNGFYQILTARKLPRESETKATKIIEGMLKVNKGYGFVRNAFVESSFIEHHQLKNKQRLRVKAMLSYNKKKCEWSWKVVGLLGNLVEK